MLIYVWWWWVQWSKQYQKDLRARKQYIEGGNRRAIVMQKENKKWKSHNNDEKHLRLIQDNLFTDNCCTVATVTPIFQYWNCQWCSRTRLQWSVGRKSFNNKRLPMKDEKSTRWWWPLWSEPKLRQLGGFTGSLIISIGHIGFLARVCTTTLKDQTRARCLWPRWSEASNILHSSTV